MEKENLKELFSESSDTNPVMEIAKALVPSFHKTGVKLGGAISNGIDRLVDFLSPND